MSFLQSFRNLPPRTRLYLGLGAIVWSGVGLALSDKAEDVFGLRATERDREELRGKMPVKAVKREG